MARFTIIQRQNNQSSLFSISATQNNQWEDIRLPQQYVDHYNATGLCLNCTRQLRHIMHAFNHYKKYHLKGKRYFKYLPSKNVFVEVNRSGYWMARQKGLCTAITKM